MKMKSEILAGLAFAPASVAGALVHALGWEPQGLLISVVNDADEDTFASALFALAKVVEVDSASARAECEQALEKALARAKKTGNGRALGAIARIAASLGNAGLVNQVEAEAYRLHPYSAANALAQCVAAHLALGSQGKKFRYGRAVTVADSIAELEFGDAVDEVVEDLIDIISDTDDGVARRLLIEKAAELAGRVEHLPTRLQLLAQIFALAAEQFGEGEFHPSPLAEISISIAETAMDIEKEWMERGK